MATYKIPQNVEAEDKLLGPFTFRQFIYLLISSFAIFIGWLMLQISAFLIVIPLPFIIVFGILGIYHREDQPVETYLLAAINFLTKPHKRIWDPEGISENVRITAPKKIATPSLKRLERGQLERLAHVVDTRGWYVKRPELQEPIGDPFIADDDRLVSIGSQVDQEPIDVHLTDDVLSPTNPALDEFSDLAEKSHQQAKSTAIKKMREASSQQSAQPKSPPGTSQPAIELPHDVHYNPYPTDMTQHVLDPKSGSYQTTTQHQKNTKPAPVNTQSAVSKQFAAKTKVSDIAKVVNKPSSNLEQGQEIRLPHGQ